MSPFEEVTDRIAGQVRSLSPAAQVALFLSAGRALTRSYADWIDKTAQISSIETLLQAASIAEEYVLGKQVSVGPSLIAELEERVPYGHSEIESFIAAQDCWICIDTAVRVAMGGVDPSECAWYLLEPMFQATSERLFGLNDVGSEVQSEMEQLALADAALASAVEAVELAVANLNESVGQVDLKELVKRLDVLNPR